MNKIIQGDCLEVMKDIFDGSIDMVLTSPPYDNLRTYNGSLDWGEHVWKPVIQELFRIIKDGKVVVWVVGDATIKGSETGTSFKQALYFKEVGFNLHDTMIWQKDTFTAVGALVNRYAPVFEYMFILSKGYPKTFNPIKDRKNITAGLKQHGTIRKPDNTKVKMSTFGNIVREFGQRHNVWKMSGEKRRNISDHPAVFPEKLAHDHIISWSNEGDTILDPFAGSGTVGKVAQELNRNYILIEREPEYINIIKERVSNNKGHKSE
jgi:site-specific DNA-methyltransferase (adenine-specific)